MTEREYPADTMLVTIQGRITLEGDQNAPSTLRRNRERLEILTRPRARPSASRARLIKLAQPDRISVQCYDRDKPVRSLGCLSPFTFLSPLLFPQPPQCPLCLAT